MFKITGNQETQRQQHDLVSACKIGKDKRKIENVTLVMIIVLMEVRKVSGS